MRFVIDRIVKFAGVFQPYTGGANTHRIFSVKLCAYTHLKLAHRRALDNKAKLCKDQRVPRCLPAFVTALSLP